MSDARVSKSFACVLSVCVRVVSSSMEHEGPGLGVYVYACQARWQYAVVRAQMRRREGDAREGARGVVEG